MPEKPLRFDRMPGLDSAQLGEPEQMFSELLEEPLDKGEGRPRELNLREALIVTCGYLRQDIIEDVRAGIFDAAQSTISRCITFLTPFVEKATDEDRPMAADAAEATSGASSNQHDMAKLKGSAVEKILKGGRRRARRQRIHRG